jgi:hypothetical protein
MSTSFLILSEGRPWFSAGDVTQLQPQTRAKAKRAPKTAPQVVYPTFEECSRLTSDPFWSDIFAKAARNQFPTQFQFRNNNLTFKARNKIQTQAITPDDPAKTLSDCMMFMKATAGLHSARDTQIRDAEESDKVARREVAHNITWSSLRSAKQRIGYILDFIRHFSAANKLSSAKASQLENIIRMGLLSGMLTEANIIMVDNKIATVTGIDYNPETGQYVLSNKDYKPPRRSKKDEDPEEDIDDVGFFKSWKKLMASQERETKRSSSSPN